MRLALLLLSVCVVCAATDDGFGCDQPAYRTGYRNNTFCARVRRIEEIDQHTRVRMAAVSRGIELAMQRLMGSFGASQPAFDELAASHAAMRSAMEARAVERSVLHMDARVSALLAQAWLSVDRNFTDIDRVLANVTFPDECDNMTHSEPAVHQAMRLFVSAVASTTSLPADALFDNKTLARLQTLVNDSCATGHFMDTLDFVILRMRNNIHVQMWRAVTHLLRMVQHAYGFVTTEWKGLGRMAESSPRLQKLFVIMDNLSSIARSSWGAGIDLFVATVGMCLDGAYAWLIAPAPILFTVAFWYTVCRRTRRRVYE